MNPNTSPSIVIRHPYLGRISIFADNGGLTALTFTKMSETGAPTSAETKCISVSQGYNRLADQIIRYLAGDELEFSMDVNWDSFTPFQRKVLQRTCRIPYGRVMTYGRLAEDIGKPGAARAVGTALAANPIPILIPCHRVVGSDGSLHGYSAPGGLQTKAWLLALEGLKLLPGNPLKLTKDSYGKPI